MEHSMVAPISDHLLSVLPHLLAHSKIGEPFVGIRKDFLDMTTNFPLPSLSWNTWDVQQPTGSSDEQRLQKYLTPSVSTGLGTHINYEVRLRLLFLQASSEYRCSVCRGRRKDLSVPCPSAIRDLLLVLCST